MHARHMPGADRPLGRVIRQSAIYAVGNATVKASGLLLAPLYLNPAYLTVENFGYFALLSVTAQLGIFAVGLGLAHGLLKFMSDPELQHERQALPFTAFLSTTLAAAAALFLFLIGAGPLGTILLDSAASGHLVRLLAVYVVLKVVGNIPLMMLRIHERAGIYAIAVVAEMLALVGCVYYFLVVEERGLEGIMMAYAVSAGLSAGVMTVAMLSRVPWIVRTHLVRPLIRYGAPLVMAGLAGWFLNAGDRYILKWFSTTDVIAVYEWASRVAGVLNLFLVQSFQLSFSVIGLKAAARGEVEVHREAFRRYVVWSGWGVLGLALLAYDVTVGLVVHFGADPAYLEVETLAFPIALGFLSYGLYIVVNNILYAVGKTRMIGANVVAAAILNALLNILLIPLMGALGAAIATFVAFSALAGIAALQAERKMPVNYPWQTAIVVILLCIVLYLAGHLTMSWEAPARVAARLAIIASYPLLIVITRTYGFRGIRDWFSKWAGRSVSR